MTNIEKLYYNLDKLTDGYKDSKEVKESRNSMEKALGDELYRDFGDEIGDYAAAYEKQGFIWGFQYAVSLLTSRGAGERV